MSERPAPGSSDAVPAGVATLNRQPAAAPLTLDASALVARYTNFVQVTGTPEEVILDIGFDRPPIATSRDKVAAPGSRVFDQRLVVSFFTAKRLWRALELAVKRHEAAFGHLETDVRRRLARDGS